MNNKIKPALLGGLIVGLLSAIPFVNYCCCIWGIGGGALATFLYIKNSATPVRPGDGAMIGGLAGIFGALIYLVIGVPLAYFMAGGAAMAQQLAKAGVNVPFSGAMLVIFGGIVAAIVLVILSVLGGLIAVPIFEKRKGDVPPPPPQM
jgi:hypothetical protein